MVCILQIIADKTEDCDGILHILADKTVGFGLFSFFDGRQDSRTSLKLFNFVPDKTVEFGLDLNIIADKKVGFHDKYDTAITLKNLLPGQNPAGH